MRHAKVLVALALMVVLAFPSSTLLPLAFAPSGNTWYVAPTGNPTHTYGGSCSSPAENTISAAITDAAAGDTILVCLGTYTEQPVISKTLTITGIKGSSKTIIQAPNPMKTTFVCSPTTGPCAADTYGEDNIVTITGATTTAVLSGFNITGTKGNFFWDSSTNVNICDNGAGEGTGTLGLGIFVEGGATATITNNIIDHIHNTPYYPCAAYGIGIWVGRGGAASTPATATISDNVIFDYQKSAIVVDGAGSTATITGNTITGWGPTTLIAQNGIQVSRGAVATLSLNTISGNSFSNSCDTENYFTACAQASGIILYDSGSVTIRGNGVSENDIGVWAVDDSSAPASYTISWLSNNVYNNYGYGLVFDGVTATSKTNSINNNPVGILTTDSSANAYVTSISDQFTGNVANTEAITSPGTTYSLSFIVETQPFTVLQPIQPPTHPHFP